MSHYTSHRQFDKSMASGKRELEIPGLRHFSAYVYPFRLWTAVCKVFRKTNGRVILPWRLESGKFLLDAESKKRFPVFFFL